MSNVWCQDGDKAILEAAKAEDLLAIMRLFQNNHTPVGTDVLADYTVATYSGYPGDTVPTWGAAFVNSDGKGEIDAAPVVFTRASGATTNTIYGAYFVDTDGKLMYADRFPAPIVMGTIGDTFTYTAKTTAVHD